MHDDFIFSELKLMNGQVIFGIMNSLIQFHNLSHIAISAIGGFLLLAIFYNVRFRFREQLATSDSQERVDNGLIYLSLSCFAWVLSGIWAFFSSYYYFNNTLTHDLGSTLISILNSYFLLTAISHFTHSPSMIYDLKHSKKIIFGLVSVVIALTLVISATYKSVNVIRRYDIHGIPDLLLSIFVSYTLAVSLWQTFIYRKLRSVAIISLIIIIIMFISQVPEIFVFAQDYFISNLLKIIAKTSLIFVFLVLATSWVIELANTPKPNEMSLNIMDWSLIRLNIPSKGVDHADIDFGSKTTQFKNLLKFSIRRSFAQGEQQTIEVGKGGEIKSQTYLSRIIDNINDILRLKEENQLERKDLFTFIGDGKYRLRIPTEHIVINEQLLNEFLSTPENSDYTNLCN